ncbi:MAG: hypothetical protein EOO15_23625 [Chitinophagaceae bacterium]|nr:MAG: hypothetical protein EOO15_23625 [Chitinophagaceae bacterium]
MARIFTIEFAYEGILYNALVTERAQPFATEYRLSMLSGELEDLLSARKVLLSPTGVLAFSQRDGLPGRLMESVVQAIALHVGTPA